MPCEFGVVEQPGLVQHLGVRARTGDVVVRQAPVKVRRLAQRRQRVGRPAGKTSAPEGTFVGVPGCAVFGSCVTLSPFRQVALVTVPRAAVPAGGDGLPPWRRPLLCV